MALELKQNCKVTIYRTFNSNTPYPPDNTAPVATGVPGTIKQHMRAGRFGKNTTGLHWTHVLYVDISTDVRSAYPSQLVGEDATTADTVVIEDYPKDGQC